MDTACDDDDSTTEESCCCRTFKTSSGVTAKDVIMAPTLPEIIRDANDVAPCDFSSLL